MACENRPLRGNRLTQLRERESIQKLLPTCSLRKNRRDRGIKIRTGVLSLNELSDADMPIGY